MVPTTEDGNVEYPGNVQRWLLGGKFNVNQRPCSVLSWSKLIVIWHWPRRRHAAADVTGCRSSICTTWRSSGFISCALYTTRAPGRRWVRPHSTAGLYRLIDGQRWRIEIILGSSTLHEFFSGDGVRPVARERASSGRSVAWPRLSVTARFCEISRPRCCCCCCWCHVSLGGDSQRCRGPWTSLCSQATARNAA